MENGNNEAIVKHNTKIPDSWAKLYREDLKYFIQKSYIFGSIEPRYCVSEVSSPYMATCFSVLEDAVVIMLSAKNIKS